MARLNFSSQISRTIDTRDKPSRYNRSLYRNIHRDLGPGDHLSDVYYPFKYLTAQMMDVSTEDYIVLIKGRGASLLTHYDDTGAEASGIMPPSGAQSIDIAISAIDSSYITTTIDDSFWGYPENVSALLVPANGGVTASGQYTARDVTAKTLIPGGGEVATALTAGPVITPNIPVGILLGDVYQDIRGKYLNYQLWDKAVAVSTHCYMEVPYVRIAAGSKNDKLVDPGTPEEIGTSMRFDTMNSKYVYMVIGHTDVQSAGVPVTCDTRGNYKLQNTNTAIATDTRQDSQTIGRMIKTDCRYPKDLLELVDTYEGAGMPGTDTAGIPSYLFNFAHDYAVAVSSSHRLADIVDQIQAGTFGTASILVTL